MKLLVGLLLVATALAYPLGENDEKPQEPLVISDSYASVSKSEDSKQELEKSLSHDSASDSLSSSEDSSEESTQLPQRDAQPLLDAPQESKPAEEAQPAQDEPASTTALPEELKKEEEPRNIDEESLPTLKKVDTEVAPKTLPVEGVAEAAKPADAGKVLSDEAPLALPALAEEKSAAASEIKEDIVALPSEQKVELPAAVEEKIPELKSNLDEVKQPELAEPLQEKKAKSDDAKPEEISPSLIQEESSTQPITEQAQSISEEPRPIADEIQKEEPQRVADQIATDAKPIESERPLEKQPEGKSAEPVADSQPIPDAVQPSNDQSQPEGEKAEEKPAAESAVISS